MFGSGSRRSPRERAAPADSRRTSSASASRSPRRRRSLRGRRSRTGSAIVLAEETPTAERMIALSCSLARRIANIVEHCESTVGVEFGRALRDDAERDAVFAPFLGDAADRLAGRPERLRLVGGNVAMGLFAHHRDLVAPLAPQRDFERHAREHRDERIDDLVGKAGQLHDRHRRARLRQAEDVRDAPWPCCLRRRPGRT